MARIVTVYAAEQRPFVPVDMSLIRWLKISQALASIGHQVDIATNEPGLRARFPRRIGPRLRRVPLTQVRWDRYDVVKTLFHNGFETLSRHGGADHPFIISKLGSVVGEEDRDGVYFYGEERRALFDVQTRIASQARFVSVLSEPSRTLWHSCHGEAAQVLLVPGAVDAVLPPTGPSPYQGKEPVCVFAGNFYDKWYQAEVHNLLVANMNELGERLHALGIRFHVLGHGDTGALDRRYVTCHGAVPYDQSWDYLRHADVGVVLAFGPQANENESTKIYHYLRVGLPTVCEAGFPNQDLVTQVRLGSVSSNGDMGAMAEAVCAAAKADWERSAAVETMLQEHTWEARARIYEPIIS